MNPHRFALIIPFGVFALGAGQPSLAASGRCPVEKQSAADRQRRSIVETCFAIKGLITSSILEVPTEIIADAMAPGAVAWMPRNGVLIVNPPAGPRYSGYVLCNARRLMRSEIPGPGRYLQHGATHMNSSSITYRWQLKRRKWLRGRTSLNVDLYVSFIAPRRYDAALKDGLCDPIPNLMLRSAVGWRR